MNRTEYHQNYRVKNRIKLREYNRIYNKKWRKKNGKENESKIGKAQYERRKEYFKTVRLECLSHYSNGLLACNCCKESIYSFLCLDHVNNDGHEHRKIVKGNIYVWLRKNKYPSGFQVLCHNCNMAKALYKSCPHQKLSTT